MADHLDAPGLMPPGGDASIDITDVYAFQKPGDAGKSILMLNVNPLTLSSAFNPNALYELKVDTNGNAIADVAFRFKFSPLDKHQTVTVRRAAGAAAPGNENTGDVIVADAPVSFGDAARVTDSGPYRFFAGLRSDPFFFDLFGFLDHFNFTGTDFFADKNVFGIALEVPNSALGPAPNVGIWGRTLLPESDSLSQVERMGRPAINTVFMAGTRKNDFNRGEPKDDVANFTAEVVAVLRAFGHTPAEAAALAAILLPDILTYNYSSGAGFLNGRKLTDDVIDAELALVSKGAVTTDGVGVHTDLRKDFPHMGRPHRVR